MTVMDLINRLNEYELYEIKDFEVIFQNNRDNKVIQEYENVKLESVLIEKDSGKVFLI